MILQENCALGLTNIFAPRTKLTPDNAMADDKCKWIFSAKEVR